VPAHSLAPYPLRRSVLPDVPGVAPSNIDLRLDGDTLTIQRERKSASEQKQANYRLLERSCGRFQRSLQLPFAPDPGPVRPDFDNGLLTVHLPRKGQQQRSGRIEVRSGASGTGAGATIAANSRRTPSEGSAERGCRTKG
jgi:HSP20 family protein